MLEDNFSPTHHNHFIKFYFYFPLEGEMPVLVNNSETKNIKLKKKKKEWAHTKPHNPPPSRTPVRPDAVQTQEGKGGEQLTQTPGYISLGNLK